MIITCLALAGLAALGLEWVLQHGRGVAALGAALVLVAVDLLAGVTAYRPTAADEGNRAHAALRQEGGRLLEMPVYAPDRQEASVYLYYAMQAPRERPAGYSTVAPKEAARVLRELQPCADVRNWPSSACGTSPSTADRSAESPGWSPVTGQSRSTRPSYRSLVAVELESYTFVLLRRGPRADEYSEAELEEIQAGHLAFLDRMRREGHIVLSGRSATRTTRPSGLLDLPHESR